MKISLNQFEQLIDETILKRGLSYFKNGFVSKPEEITAGVYEAIVSGSEDYRVVLQIKKEAVVEHDCTCPYDMGPVCKHIVAVLFYLQQDVLETAIKTVPPTSVRESVVKKRKKKIITDRVNEILEKISHDELKQFVLKNAKDNPPLRVLFLSSFAYKNTDESKEFYTKQIRSMLKTAAGRGGFIFWNEARTVGKSVYKFLETAQKHFANKNYKSAIYIGCAVLEEMTVALQFGDDSNGDFGGNIDTAIELLYNIANENLPKEERTLLFDYCLASFDQETYSGWDAHFAMLRIAVQILNDDEETQRIIIHLDKEQSSAYEKEAAQILKLEIIRKTKGEKEAKRFIEQNLDVPDLRREAITYAIKNKQYEKGITLSKEGITQDEKNKPGLANEWYEWLLKIAQAQHHKEKIIEYARLLFIDNFRHEQDYYELMKSNTARGHWVLFVEEIIKEISTKNGWFNADLISKIYIKEKWWDRLLKLLAQNPSLQNIDQYEKYLSTDYAAEIANLYKISILKYLNQNTGRGHYKMICKYLRRMKKLGAGNEVNSMVEFFKKEYNQRRALMEELELV